MNQNNLSDYPYSSQRRVVMGRRGAVATGQPLATAAGMEMLHSGGNAVDAAVAMAITLTVVEPTANGIGSDAFALVWDGSLYGLNGSGKSPQNLTKKTFCGMQSPYGWLPVTVPGAVSAWRALWERWGRLSFERLFEPAIRYAEEGYPVSPVVAEYWKRAEQIYLPLNDTIFTPLKDVFFRNNRAPAAGEIWGSAAHAETLREIARTGGESFYKGKLAERIANYAAETGGFLTQEDLVAHQTDWVTPISTEYHGLTVWEMPPNTQGIAALMALNILENFDISQYARESVESYHLQIEAMKLAFADVKQYVADADFMEVGVEELLDKNYGKKRAKLITEKAISLAAPGLPKGGTVYLAAADGDLMVSFIQSNYMGFGSGVVVAGTGIALQNRGFGFSFEQGHPNEYSPGKRAYHTIIPGFLTREGVPVGPFGVMGGPMQPQGHLQVVANMADYEMNPQAALDAPRWQFIEGNLVLVESGVAESIIEGLQRRGHDVRLGDLNDGSDVAETGQFGRGQIIVRENGVFVAGSEPRADGLAIAW